MAIVKKSSEAEKVDNELHLAAAQMIDQEIPNDNGEDSMTLSDVSGEVPSEHDDNEKQEEEEKKEGATE